MSQAQLSQGVEVLLAFLTLALAIGGGFLVARAGARLGRRATREREAEFRDQLDVYLERKLGGRELLQSAAGLDPDSFWAALDASLDGFTSRARRELERVLDHSRHVSAERRALRDDAPWRRERAARRLGTLGARRHSRALRRAMGAGPEFVTLAAAQALGRARDRRALEWLLAHPSVIEHRSPQLHIALLQSFGRGAAPVLLMALQRGVATRRMERAAIETLAWCGHLPAVPLIARALGHEWRDLRVSAVRALGTLGAREYATRVRSALDDEAWQVRAQAARALGLLRDPDSVMALAARLDDRAWWVRRHAAYALFELGDAGRHALQRAAKAHADPYAREIAAEALSGGFPGNALGHRRAAP